MSTICISNSISLWYSSSFFRCSPRSFASAEQGLAHVAYHVSQRISSPIS
jgi:hypothetical protein